MHLRSEVDEREEQRVYITGCKQSYLEKKEKNSTRNRGIVVIQLNFLDTVIIRKSLLGPLALFFNKIKMIVKNQRA